MDTTAGLQTYLRLSEAVARADLDALFTALTESLPDALAFVDAHGVVRYVNRRMAEDLDVEPRAVLGQPIAALAERFAARFAGGSRELAGLLEAGEAREGRRRELHRADGRVFECACVPVLSGEAFRGQLVQLHDLTARRRIEEHMLHMHKMESVGRLAGGVAHDFNNMLTTIIGYLDLAVASLPAGSEERDYLVQALDAADQAAGLTGQLLTFARLQPVSPTHQDLNQLLERMTPLLRHLVPESVAIVVRRSPQPCGVLADPSQLEQVLVQLVLNARDAMPEGGTLTLGAAPEPEPAAGERAMAVLEVSDTGVGMDEETRAHAFEPFYTTKAERPGAGLGLATVYGIVQQCGGQATVTSAPGRGATFRVLLPSAEPAEPGAALAPSPGLPRGTETVLLVEDDAAVRALIQAMLSRLGYTVLAEARAEEALPRLERHEGRVDLLIADIVMPGMSGRDLAVRAQALRPGLRVLLVSGYSSTTTAAAGPFAFLAKPFSIEALAGTVRAALADPARPTGG